MQKFEKHSPVVVTEVTTKHELRQFMQYPNRLYADNPNYIPSFYGDDLSDWTPGKNPAFDYCEARCWLARRDGEIVGRIGAILSHKANDKFGTHRMRFSQVDFVDDSEVSAALFGTVERWARERAATRCTARSASRTWTARVCSSRALTAEACFHQLQRAVLSRAPHPTRLPQGC